MEAMESVRLTELETVIAVGLKTFVDVGNALLEIRDSRLYRGEWGTFEEYCRDRWAMSRPRAYQLIDAAQVSINVSTIVDTPPATESQARPLTALEPEAQRTAWQTAVDTAPGGKVTAAHVQSVVNTMTGKVAPVAEVVTPAMDLETAEQIVKEARQIRRDEIRQDRTERINDIARNNQPLHAEQRYPVILADPPWRYEHSKTTSREIENHYPTMSLEEICDLPVDELATPDAILFLWTTSPKLAESMKVIEAWGFEYRTCMVWVKDKIGMGYYARQRHELMLIARRGEMPVPEPSARFDSVIEWPRTEHSAKPPIIYERIELMYADFDKVELFARSRREGWAAWGNQADG